MALKNNDITLTIAVIMIVVLAWMSKGNLSNHYTVKGDLEMCVDELDTLKSCLVRVDTSFRGLIIYYPATDSIVLRCFDPPTPENDSSIAFSCAAAFTRYDRPHNNYHLYIAGNHVCFGERKKGCSCSNKHGRGCVQ